MRKTDYLRKSLVVSALAVVLGGSPALADFGASFQGLGLPGSWFDSRAQDVSADGSVAVGYGHSSTVYEAFRWTQSGGTVGLGDSP